ncbi:hypothetical protein F4604DRAFT_1688673 [Suillus subluteus]|nr:hypothetical protein F4604DRAFT_1688673 [Suillus subluteus]
MDARTSESSAPLTDSFATEFSFEPYMVAEDSNSIGSEQDLSIAADSGSTVASNCDSTTDSGLGSTAPSNRDSTNDIITEALGILQAKLELKMDENLSCLAALGETNAIFVDCITEIANETKEAAQKVAEEAKEAAEANNVEVQFQIQEVKAQIQEVKNQIDAGKSILVQQRQNGATELQSVVVEATIQQADSTSTESLPVCRQDEILATAAKPATQPFVADADYLFKRASTGSTACTSKVSLPVSENSHKSDGTSRTFTLLSQINSELDLCTQCFNLVDLKLSFRAPISLSEDLPPLESDGASNDEFMLHRKWLVSTLDELDAIKDFGNKEILGRRTGLVKQIERDINSLLAFEDNQWRLAKVRANLHGLPIGNDEKQLPTIQAEHFYGHQRLPQEPFLLAALFFVTVLRLLVGASQPQVNFTLLSLTAIISGALSYGKVTLSNQTRILKLIPRDAHTVLSRFEIEPDIVLFACCPRCSATYPPDFSTKLLYPNQCNFQSTPAADVCGMSLLKTKGTSDDATSGDQTESVWSGQPIKLYGYQRMSAWLARLFSCPELKDYMTHAWDQKSDGGRWTDIWDAPGLHEIKGPDGKPFSIQPPGSVHLARKVIVKMSVTGLMALRKGYVVAMAIHNQVSPIGGEFNKQNYTDGLIAWVRHHPNVDIKVPSAGAEPTREFILPGTEYLVIAVDIATKQSTSSRNIDIYRTHMTRYLLCLLELFPENKLQTNHHLSLHLEECLARFGPVRGWWSFPFERYSGIIQDINTNNKPGEMEMTFLRYFCLVTNLRIFAKTIHLPDTPQYNAMMLSFRNLFESKIHGVLMDNLTPGNTSPHRLQLSKLEKLEDHIYHGLLHQVNLDITDASSCFTAWDDESSLHPLLNFKAQAIHCIKVQGTTYSSFRNHPGNSFVLFPTPTAPGQSSARTAGQVQQVFMHEKVTGSGL